MDLLKLYEDFFFGRAKREKINWASIVLIPKVVVLEGPGDYRPISLINASLKILLKLLAMPLSKVLNSLVDADQSFFLKGHCILDNFATAEELMFSLHKHRILEHILKVVFAKAFDLVDLDFCLSYLVLGVLGKDRWVGSGVFCFPRRRRSHINGSLNQYIRYQRGLRLGDPLSPLLFVLVTDVLSLMFTHALSSKILIGVPLGDFGSKCNLHYADDLLVLSKGGLEDLRIIKLILYLFEGITQLETNFYKACLYSCRMGELPDSTAAAILNCTVGLLPVTYLGIPLSSRWPCKQDWEGLILKVKRRLSSWKEQHL